MLGGGGEAVGGGGGGGGEDTGGGGGDATRGELQVHIPWDAANQAEGNISVTS